MPEKTKVHTRYRNEANKIVPGVTTILGATIPKPALIHWAWKEGIEGRDYKKVRDKAADIGTIAHYMIECHLLKNEPDLSEYSQANIDKAETAFLAYLDWEKNHKLHVVETEARLVSEIHQYGGTMDLIATSGDELWLIDFKTSKGIYKDMEYQVAAYKHLYEEENGCEIDKSFILQISKEDGSFNYKQLGDLKKEWAVFEGALNLYRLVKEAK